MKKYKVPFGSVQFGDIARKNIQECLDRGWGSQGEKVLAFEQKYRNLFGYKHTRMVSSGTMADTICCMSLYEINGAVAGDEVICPALSFIATANSIRAANLTPRFIDVDLNSMNIDVSQIEKKINKKTRAIMAVNLLGRPAELDRIREIADKYNLVVICDNCESYGCYLKGKFSLEYCDFETSSHFVAHIITTGAEGGTVSTNNTEYNQLVEAIRSHGRMYGKSDFIHPIWGVNGKCSDLHASVGLEGLSKFWEVFDKRKSIIYKIRESVRGFEDLAYFTEEHPDGVNAPHGFAITMKYPHLNESLKQTLQVAGIEAKLNFGSMPHHRCFSYLGYRKGDFPNAEFLGTGIHIGASQYWTDEQVNYVCETLHRFFQNIK